MPNDQNNKLYDNDRKILIERNSCGSVTTIIVNGKVESISITSNGTGYQQDNKDVKVETDFAS